MSADRIIFWAFAIIFVLGGSLFTITRRNAVSAVMSLVATFFALAVVYVCLSAHFLAALQVLVYAGAIMTLFVFVVMVLNRDEMDPWARRGLLSRVLGIGLSSGGLVGLSFYLLDWKPEVTLGDLPGEWGGVASVGEVLFSDYLFPFEAISLLLLIAVIAAVVVARTPRQMQQLGLEESPPTAAEPSDAGSHP
ncbi:MAG TPA: NADH-quinone oxidoreductase subunit J [Polyangia bacterium]|jgi:NADH-quinone oxidoreductase subunit J|nr:NADH-quinone oxidoreductase subunit J [Polyangia bacterium]